MNKMMLNYFTNDDNFPFFIQYGRHDDDLYIHVHEDFFELVIVLEGSATHIVDDERFYIQKGDVFVIGNDTSHGYVDTINFRICNIMYRLEFLFPSNYDITRSAGFHALFMLEPYFSKECKFISRFKLAKADFDPICERVSMMILDFKNKVDGWHTYVLSNFLTLVVILSRLYVSNESNKKTDVFNIAKAVSFIENHFNEEISLALLAELSNYSERHFLRIFSETYHTTPVNYIIALRIRKACTLLKENRIPISYIALQCGFNDSNYFSRIFKKQLGVSPREYRNYENSKPY